MPQTSVAAPAVGQVGTFATVAPREITDRIAAEAIPYGSLVVLTANDETTCELPDATTEISADGRRLGVALAKKTAGDGVTEPTGYASGERVDIALAGEVYIFPAETVVAGDPPFVTFDVTQGDALGTFRNDANTSTAVQLPRAVFKTGGGTAVLAILKLSL